MGGLPQLVQELPSLAVSLPSEGPQGSWPICLRPPRGPCPCSLQLKDLLLAQAPHHRLD